MSPDTNLLPVTDESRRDQTPLVSICCAAYNHDSFIGEAIEGFLMQRTCFPVEILIHDDASTDRTAAIVRNYEARYPWLIRTIYQSENQ
jgi:glycosyltransferase involved in cell wall biosynthesis